MSKEKTLISILIPVYNEEGNIAPLFAKLDHQIKTNEQKYDFETIFVDDGSTDRTLAKLVELAQLNRENNAILYNHFSKNRGKTQALLAGFEQCKGDLIITMDGDLQDDPCYLGDFIAEYNKGDYDMLVGNRVNKYKKNLAKRVSSSIANKLAGLIIQKTIHDMNCGFKLIRAECARNLVLKSDYHRYIPLIAAIDGYKIGEVDIEQKARLSGESKYGGTGLGRAVASILDMLSVAFVYKFKKEPFRLFGRLGLMLFGAGALIMVYLVARWFFGYYIYGRPLFFVSILLLILGFNVLSMGFLGELIVINADNRKNK